MLIKSEKEDIGTFGLDHDIDVHAVLLHTALPPARKKRKENNKKIDHPTTFCILKPTVKAIDRSTLACKSLLAFVAA